MRNSGLKYSTLIGLAASLFWCAGARAAVYNHPTGDSIDGADSDIASVAVTNDASNIYFQITLSPSANLPADDFTDYEMGFQMNGGAGGQTLINNSFGTAVADGNPFGQKVGISTGENYWIGTYLSGSGYTGEAELYSFNASTGWSQVATPNITEGTNTIAFQYPLSALGLSVGSSFNFDLWTTFGNPGGQSAYDALDNPNNIQSEIPGYFPYSNGSGTPTPYDSATANGSNFATTIYTVTAAVPEPISMGTTAAVAAMALLRRRQRA